MFMVTDGGFIVGRLMHRLGAYVVCVSGRGCPAGRSLRDGVHFLCQTFYRLGRIALPLAELGELVIQFSFAIMAMHRLWRDMSTTRAEYVIEP